MTLIHHPAGDAKKFASTNLVSKTENVVATSCRVVTKVIDFFISLFGGRAITETVCSYVDVPQYVVPLLNTGAIRGGSSGSPFFTNGSRLFGITSASLGQCVNVAPFFGKFRNAYANREMRDNLNPIYNAPANAFGYDGRDIGCYTDTPLRLSGDYLPAQDYQPTNPVVISASTSIEAGQTDSDNNGCITAFVDYTGNNNSPQAPVAPALPGVEERRLRVYNRADFTFTAGQSIRLLPGFTVDAGARFTARIQPCNANARQGVDDNMALPPVVVPALSAPEAEPTLTLSPNPSGETVSCQYWVKQPGLVQLVLYDLQGKAVGTLFSAPDAQPGGYNVERSIASVVPGLYLVQLKSTNHTESKRLLVQR